MGYVNEAALTQLITEIKNGLVIKDKTEAQAIAAASTYPNNIYYTSDTNCIVVSGQIYGRGDLLPQLFEMVSVNATVGVSPYDDTSKLYLQSDNLSDTIEVYRGAGGGGVPAPSSGIMGSVTLGSGMPGIMVHLIVNYSATSVGGNDHYTKTESYDDSTHVLTVTITIDSTFIVNACEHYFYLSDIFDAIMDISADFHYLNEVREYFSNISVYDPGNYEIDTQWDINGWIDVTTADQANLIIWGYNTSMSRWWSFGSYNLHFDNSASAISYDLTNTPDLGDGDVQSAIESLDNKVEQLSLDVMGEYTDGTGEEYLEDQIFGKKGWTQNNLVAALGATDGKLSNTSYTYCILYSFAVEEGEVWEIVDAVSYNNNGSANFAFYSVFNGSIATTGNRTPEGFMSSSGALPANTKSSYTLTVPTGAKMLLVATQTRAGYNTLRVYKKVNKAINIVDRGGRVIDEWQAGIIISTIFRIGNTVGAWAATTSTISGVRLAVKQGDVLNVDIISPNSWGLIFTDTNRVIVELYTKREIKGMFSAPCDGYAYIQRNTAYPLKDCCIYEGTHGQSLKKIYDDEKAFAKSSIGALSSVNLGYDITECMIEMPIDVEGFKYGVNLYNSNNKVLSGNVNAKFQNNTNIVYFPNFDWSGVTSVSASGTASTSSPLKGCTNMKVVPKITLGKTALFLNNLFVNCSSLKYFGGFDSAAGVSNESCQDYYAEFGGCSILEWIGDLSCFRATAGYKYFTGCSWLRHVEFVDFIARNQTSNSYNANNILSDGVANLRYIVIKNIGYKSTALYEFLQSLTVWGKNSTDELNARQSLVDSLLTYSFDRAGANETARQEFIADALGTVLGVYTSDALPETADDGDLALVTGSADVMVWSASTSEWVVIRTAETGDKYATATSAYTWSGSAWTQWTKPYPTFTIRMATATYNLLTSEEKAAVVARGYSITAV